MLLRPGVRVCRRSATDLQVGVGGRVAVLADDPGVRLMLSGLADGRPPGPMTSLSPVVRVAWQRLLHAGLVVDADVWCTAVAGVGSFEGAAARTRSALVADLGDEAAVVLAARSRHTITVTGAGLPETQERLTTLLGLAGLHVSPSARPDLVVHASLGEPDRYALDDLVRADVAHVVLTVIEGQVTVGPLVQPGATACQRCVDAALAERDPRRALVVEQYSGVTSEPWGLPTPVPHDLAELAAAFLARDLSRWADGDAPVTWSTSVTIDAALSLPRRRWRRHAACGCSANIAVTA